MNTSNFAYMILGFLPAASMMQENSRREADLQLILKGAQTVVVVCAHFLHLPFQLPHPHTPILLTPSPAADP